MFGQIAERRMHLVRWILTSGWLLLIFSLFYDPLSPWLTDPNNEWSPLRLDPSACVEVQGVCLQQQPYPLGTTLFWGAIVPASIFILLVFGHELWRRICPLSFLSQIPRALGIQRQTKRVNPKTGAVRYELAKVKPGSWLGRNYLYLQFGLLYLGLCARILFINSDRLALAAWFLVTIGAAIAVGYLYGGKSWCNYFCPMAPVQKIYAEPGGLFASKAHVGDQQITQSMCRTVGTEGKEQSACVACQNPCIDIDSERSYWGGVGKPEQKFLYYSYVGLVVGYFCYYYLYAGNWTYYFSGAWAHQEDQLATLMNPGFYLLGTAIPIPKLVAVPLTLAVTSALGYLMGRFAENWYQAQIRRSKLSLSPDLIQHRIFTVLTFAVFNFFFIFGGRPLILLLPLPLQFFYEAVLVGLSTLWFYQTWNRSPDRYTRESLATRLRRQLARLKLDLSQFIEGRTLEDLGTDEVYVLAKVLPGFTKEKRHEAYKGVLREALEEGYVNTVSSLEVLQQVRSELEISDEEHRLVLEELGVEDPELLDPSQQRSRENLVRLNGYRKALERMLTLQQRSAQDPIDERQPHKRSISDLIQNEPEALRTLRREFSVTMREETEILERLDPQTVVLRRADFLLHQLEVLIDRYHALNQPILHQQERVLTLLRAAVKQKKRLLVMGLLEMIEHCDHDARNADSSEPVALQLARSLAALSPSVLQELLEESALRADQPSSWHQRLSPKVLYLLGEPEGTPACSLTLEPAAIAVHLEALLFEPNPLLQAVSFYVLYQLEPERARAQARHVLQLTPKACPLVQETAATILRSDTQPQAGLMPFPTLEKLVFLFNSDFFAGIHSETLIELANRSVIKQYTANEVITEAGDTCRELLLLIEGVVQIQRRQSGGEIVYESLLPGYVLDELEVLSHAELANTIVAQASSTRILAVPVDMFDDILEHDSDFARRVLKMESDRLRQLVRPL